MKYLLNFIIWFNFSLIILLLIDYILNYNIIVTTFETIIGVGYSSLYKSNRSIIIQVLMLTMFTSILIKNKFYK